LKYRDLRKRRKNIFEKRLKKFVRKKKDIRFAPAFEAEFIKKMDKRF